MGATLQQRSGRCLCGAVTLLATPSKHEMEACHCGLCRKWSGGVFMAVPCEDVKVEGGDAVGCYTSSEWAERIFCRNCGSSLVWRMRGGGFVAVSVQSLDDKSGLVFAEEIFIDEKPNLYDFAGIRTRKTGAEVVTEAMANAASKAAL